MIGAILDRALSLFGRSYLLAALLPTLLFAIGVACLLEKPNDLRQEAIDWTRLDAGEATLAVVGGSAAIFLAAYVLHSVRGGLQALFQGYLPRWARWLDGPALKHGRRTFAKARQPLMRAEDACNVPDWARRDDRPFRDPYVEIPVRGGAARKRLERAEEAHATVVRELAAGTVTSPEAYHTMLEDAYVLQGSAEGLPADLSERVDTLVNAVERTYRDHPVLQQHVALLDDITRQRLALESNAFYGRFPEYAFMARPTRLGNVLAAVDSYSLRRYGIDTTTLWPRLLHVLPDEMRSRVDERSIFLDFCIAMSTLSLGAGAVALVMLIEGPDRPLLIRLAALALCVVLFRAFYSLAVGAGRALADQIEAAIDLFRLQLLDALEFPRPQDLSAERSLWHDVELFLVQGFDRGLTLRQPGTDQSQP